MGNASCADCVPESCAGGDIDQAGVGKLPLQFPTLTKNQQGSVQSGFHGYRARQLTRYHRHKRENPETLVLSETSRSAVSSRAHVTIPDLAQAVRATYAQLGAYVTESLNDGVAVHMRDAVLFENGSVYVGEWSLDGKRHGRGRIITRDGAIYEGQLKSDRCNGLGRQIYIDGSYYHGQFQDDLRHGEGNLVIGENEYYRGLWRKDLKHGKGDEVWSDGSRYQGNYTNGVKSGKGVYLFSSGKQYVGNFSNNRMDGWGILTWPNETRRYAGEWRNNQMHGQGTFSWKDGRQYKGSYINDEKHGQGEFCWPNGKMYKGEWKHGKQDGIGVYRSDHKSPEMKGEWLSGKRIRWFDAS